MKNNTLKTKLYALLKEAGEKQINLTSQSAQQILVEQIMKTVNEIYMPIINTLHDEIEMLHADQAGIDI